MIPIPVQEKFEGKEVKQARHTTQHDQPLSKNSHWTPLEVGYQQTANHVNANENASAGYDLFTRMFILLYGCEYGKKR